jgi:hypothetical protein
MSLMSLDAYGKLDAAAVKAGAPPELIATLDKCNLGGAVFNGVSNLNMATPALTLDSSGLTAVENAVVNAGGTKEAIALIEKIKSAIVA